MRAIPQTQVYAGLIFYAPPQFLAVMQAMSKFQANSKDPKADIIAYMIMGGGQLFIGLYCFYDAPSAPNGTFDNFFTIPHTADTVQTQSFSSFIQSTNTPSPPR